MIYDEGLCVQCMHNSSYDDEPSTVELNSKKKVFIELGLPQEGEEDLIKSIEHINDKAGGIKPHLLYILKNIGLEKMYREGDNRLLSMIEYLHLLKTAITHLNRNIVIHGLTVD